MPPTMRAACYARYSSDMQRETSLTDQIATARRYATSQGWHVLDEHIYTDAAISGTSIDGRPGLQALLATAESPLRPFDVLLVDDSSRVARDLADALRTMQRLRFAGVRVLYLSQGIDSDSEQADTLVAIHGMVDGLFVREMSAKIKRGLAGQVERGFATGSNTFGYRTVPVLDPHTKTAKQGMPARLGMRVEIDSNEALVVVRMFECYASGLGIGRVVEQLNREGLRGPRGGRWKQGAVLRALANEKYRGRLIWGQTTVSRRPGTRQLVPRAVAREHWCIQERSELRIVSEDLWQRVRDRRAAVRGTLPKGQTLMRGRNAALFSRHLFSGFMKCASCAGTVVVVTGGAGSPRYGCLRSWRNGVSACANRLTIRACVADAHLLAGLKAELLAPATVKYITEALAAGLNRRIDDRPRQLAEAQGAREHTAQRLQRLIDAIEQGVPAATLAGQISERQAELARLDATLVELVEPLRQRLAIMPAWVRQQLEDLVGLVGDSPERTKAEFQRLELRVTMAPIAKEQDRPFYRATVVNSLPWPTGVTDIRTNSPSAVDRLDL